MSTETKVQALEQFVIAITRQLLRRGILPQDALEDIKDGAHAMAEAAGSSDKRDMAENVSMLAHIALSSPIAVRSGPALQLVGGTDISA